MPSSDPIPPGHGEPASGELRHWGWTPVCPTCDGSVRRDLDNDSLDWRCDLHGLVVPRWERTDDKEAD